MPANQTQYRRPAGETAIEASVPVSHDPAALGAIIEKNRVTIRKNWAELDRLTRKLETLEAQAARQSRELNALAAREAVSPKLARAA